MSLAFTQFTRFTPDLKVPIFRSMQALKRYDEALRAHPYWGVVLSVIGFLIGGYALFSDLIGMLGFIAPYIRYLGFLIIGIAALVVIQIFLILKAAGDRPLSIFPPGPSPPNQSKAVADESGAASVLGKPRTGVFKRRVHYVENAAVILPFTFEAKGLSIETARVLAQASFYDAKGVSVRSIPYCLWTENESAPEWRVLFSRADTKEIKLLEFTAEAFTALGVHPAIRHRLQRFDLPRQALDVAIRITDGDSIDDTFWYSVKIVAGEIQISPEEDKTATAGFVESDQDLEAAVPPDKRKLTNEQKRILTNFLHQYKDNSIRLTYVSNEGALFSLELANVFMSAGWRSMARFPHPQPLMANVDGLLVQGEDEAVTKAVAGILRSVRLTAKGGGPNPTLPVKWISILIPHIF